MSPAPWQDDHRSEPAAAVRARLGRLPLVGCRRELAVIREELTAALRGEPRAVLLAGEAGIGKSRLLGEAARLASRSGGTTLLGRCVDELGMPPFLPWIDAVAPRGRRPSAPAAAETDGKPAVPAADDAGDRASCLPRELDHLWSLLAGGESGAAAFSGPRSPEQRKLHLFETVTGSLARLARMQPLLLAFDDLHWSDAASNELLRYIVVHIEPVPLLILGAYRTEEVAANPALARTIAELDRRRLLTTVPVGPLDAAEMRKLLGRLLARDEPALAAAIHRLSDGNPFVAEEVAREFVAVGGLDRRRDGAAQAATEPDPPPLPRGVAAIIERRLDRVGKACGAALEVAALAGRQVAVDLVAAATEAEPSLVAALLDHAAALDLVRPAEPGGGRVAGLDRPADFVFSHDRVRETITAQINPVRRRELHARLGRALAAVPGREGDLARLAALTHHFRLAQQRDEAAAYAARLGEAAMRAHAHAEALRAFRTAVDLAPEGATTGVARAELLLKLGDAALAAGDAAELDAYADAKALFSAADDPRGAARALRRLGTAYARREAFELAVASFEAALAMLEEIAESRSPDTPTTGIDTDLAEALIELATVQASSLARYEEAAANGRRALAAAEQASPESPVLAAQARLSLAQALIRSGGLAEGQALLPPALALALRADQPELAAEIVGALANHHYWIGDLDASARAAVWRRELAQRAGEPYASRHTDGWLANLALARGDWEEAERLLAEAEPWVDRLESPEPRAFLRQLAGLLRFQQGRYPESVALLEEAAAGFRTSGPATLVWYLGCLAPAYLASSDPARAERIAEETEDLISALPVGSLPRCPALAQLGIVAARTGDVDAARRHYDALAAYAGQLHWVLVDRVRGMLAAALGDTAAAEEHFTAAARSATVGGIQPELALTLAEQGAARCRSRLPGIRSDGPPLLREAFAMLHGLGMAGEAARLASLLAEPLTPPSAPPAGLTEREAEVLALVAQGLTNREIGERLGISAKTVTNHLSHIFTKADLDNRAAATAFALRHGLA